MMGTCDSSNYILFNNSDAYGSLTTSSTIYFDYNAQLQAYQKWQPPAPVKKVVSFIQSLREEVDDWLKIAI
jgi:hypothetical protein